MSKGIFYTHFVLFFQTSTFSGGCPYKNTNVFAQNVFAHISDLRKKKLSWMYSFIAGILLRSER